MTKTLRRSALAALLVCAAAEAKAQFFVGAAAFGHQYADLGLYPGIQARIGYEANDGRYTANIGFNYSPASQKQDFNVPYFNTTMSEVANVSVTQRIAVYNLFFHGHFNFGNDENNFRPGLIAGFSIDEYALKYEKGNPPAGFTSPVSFGDTSFGGGIKADLGLKGNYRVGHGALFGELIVGLPITEKSTKVPVSAITHYGLQVGYKYYIGNARFAYTGQRGW